MRCRGAPDVQRLCTRSGTDKAERCSVDEVQMRCRSSAAAEVLRFNRGSVEVQVPRYSGAEYVQRGRRCWGAVE